MVLSEIIINYIFLIFTLFENTIMYYVLFVKNIYYKIILLYMYKIIYHYIIKFSY